MSFQGYNKVIPAKRSDFPFSMATFVNGYLVERPGNKVSSHKVKTVVLITITRGLDVDVLWPTSSTAVVNDVIYVGEFLKSNEERLYLKSRIGRETDGRHSGCISATKAR